MTAFDGSADKPSLRRATRSLKRLRFKAMCGLPPNWPTAASGETQSADLFSGTRPAELGDG